MKDLAWLTLLALALGGCASPEPERPDPWRRRRSTHDAPARPQPAPESKPKSDPKPDPHVAVGFALGAAAWPALGRFEARNRVELAPGISDSEADAIRGSRFDDVGLAGEISLRVCPLAVEAGPVPLRLWIGTAAGFLGQEGPRNLRMTNAFTGETIKGSMGSSSSYFALPSVEVAVAVHENLECFAGGGFGLYSTVFTESWDGLGTANTRHEDEAWGRFATFGVEVPFYVEDKSMGASIRFETKVHFFRFGDLEEKLGGELDGPLWTFNLGLALRF